MCTGNSFIDIHTHHITTGNHISVLNIQLGKDLPENLPATVYLSVGIHPWYSENGQDKFRTLYNLAVDNRVIAIGECGLDKNIAIPLAHQEKIFLNHILLSEKLRKPIIIHCVKAFDELIRIRKDTKPRMPWIIHGFDKSADLGMQCVKHGFFLSFGKVLFTNISKTIPCIKQLPPGKFFLETDETGMEISLVYKKCATIKNLSLEQLQKEIYQNFSQCFNFVPI